VSGLGRTLRWLTTGSWRAIDNANAPKLPELGKIDWRPLVILTTAVVVITLQEYFGSRSYFAANILPHDPDDEYWLLKTYMWWSGWRAGGYILIPMLVIWAMPGERLRDYYIRVRGLSGHIWIYICLFALILPAVLYASTLDSFTSTYPFYKHANRSHLDFWAWQGMYALQFVGLEFFFRGFMLKGLERSFGSGAIFVMMVPYTMIHFGKPMLETFGAIIAGIALGTLAMRTRSMWGGAFLHIAVAITMDLLAVNQCPPADEGMCPGRQ
jgi:membrane protease YdiL (CAAX protease family)